MSTAKPIRRCKELVSLSRDHHDGLLLCWKINTGLDRDISVHRVAAYTRYFYDNFLKLHFEEEEQYLFPLLPATNENVKMAIEQHNTLRAIIESNMELTATSLRRFSDVLRMHIRLEERMLFNEIQDTVDINLLKEIESKLKGHVSKEAWADQFWTKKSG